MGGHSWSGEALGDRPGEGEPEGGKERETPVEETPGGQSQEAQMKTIRWKTGPGAEVRPTGRPQAWGYSAALGGASGWVLAQGTSSLSTPCTPELQPPHMTSRLTMKVTSSGEPSWIEACGSPCHVPCQVCHPLSQPSAPPVCPAPGVCLGPGVHEDLGPPGGKSGGETEKPPELSSQRTQRPSRKCRRG